jgi:hypothetical protein
MLRDVELADTGSGNERAAARERAHPHLIVIGSLIDRLPNLGKAFYKSFLSAIEIFGLGKIFCLLYRSLQLNWTCWCSMHCSLIR